MEIDVTSAEECAATCTAESALDFWRYSSPVEHDAVILPDGCRDLILSEQAGRSRRWFISDLGHRSERVWLSGETETLGIRLKPGVQIDEALLLTWISENGPSALMAGSVLDEFCRLHASTKEILDCLKSGLGSVGGAAARLGVSTRTLQREVQKRTGESPLFWMSLARVRRAARRLRDDPSPAELAISCGYADQAHLCRDIKRWFGVTPKGLLHDETLWRQLDQTGYA
ncbi:MAG: helix-turn-helix domain-containing protein [Pseudomonadota bacterium]